MKVLHAVLREAGDDDAAAQAGGSVHCPLEHQSQPEFSTAHDSIF